MDEVSIQGIVNIKNGNNHAKVENHIVSQGIINLLWWMIGSGTYVDGGVNSWHGELGSDTSTTTTPSMIALTTVISASEDSKSGSLDSGVGYYEVTYHFTWNSGSVTGTLGEVGLFLTLQTNTGFNSYDSSSSNILFSRLSSADADFSSFVIDDTVPLTIDWTIRFEFV